ncbi:MAG: NAD-dependent epimerase/dehydratase family protein [Lentisphaerae bacterium]|nr:NAD-dependent epimerase/dehydratase family protein [Lentisphaerota bacterium]
MGQVLITGAFGFVGTHLSAWLAERGRGVWALDVAGAAPASGGAYARLFTWKDLERVPWDEVDAVVHLAGKAHDTRRTADPQSYFDINAGLTEKIVRRIVDAAPPRPIRFILFSSVKACADAVDGVLTEDSAPAPQTPYGKSKLEAERIVREAAAAHPLALCGVILRPCMIHGPGNKGNLNLLYTLVQKGAPWPLGGFDNRRSFASIENVCAVVEGLLAGIGASGIYQVADDETLSTNELISLMAETLGQSARIWRVPAGWIRLAARVGDVLRLPLNSERLRKLTESYVVSNLKIKSALGWKTMPVSARAAMKLTLKKL